MKSLKPAIIMAIIIGIIVAVAFSVLLIPSLQKQHTDKETTGDQSDEIAWQLLQKTYLEQECREKFIGQSGELEDCFDRIEEEQRLNPPTKP